MEHHELRSLQITGGVCTLPPSIPGPPLELFSSAQKLFANNKSFLLVDNCKGRGEMSHKGVSFHLS